MGEIVVETTVFLNDAGGFLEENWPFGEPLPSIYCGPRTAAKESRFSLHAKCIELPPRSLTHGARTQ